MGSDPLRHPICFTIPKWITPHRQWHEHIPFAMFLVDLLKPSTFVELGTYYGDSYCAFCQAVQELNLSTRCYAVDTWSGDPKMGFYGCEVLATLREHHDPLYGRFSRLIQATFNEALTLFADETVDLLHIDGFHTYEAVKHDFNAWLTKISPRGVVLFHDINVRKQGFGVWKLWEELKIEYSHFDFVHGHGLGVLGVGRDQPKPFQELLQASEEDVQTIRNFFFVLGQRFVRLQGLFHRLGGGLPNTSHFLKPLFKVLFLGYVLCGLVESTTKVIRYGVLGREERAAEHRRRLEASTDFLRRFSAKVLRL